MQGEIVRREPSGFIGLRLVGTFETLSDLVEQARANLLKRQFEIPQILDPDTQLGLSDPREEFDDEEAVATHLGFEVPTASQPPKGMVYLPLSGGEYAKFDWVGSFESDAFEGFYPSIFKWFQSTGAVPSGEAYWIEVYGKDHDWVDRSNPQSRLSVYMPIGRRVA